MPNQPTSTGTATSRARMARRAVRRAGSARLALSGPSGAGKTWTALSIAQRLGDRVMVIDTEPGDATQSASSYYADHFRFDVIEWGAPYDPRDLTLTLKELGRTPCASDGFWPGAEGYQVVIVDSASHFWTGEGGTLDIADQRFSGWKVASPAQQDLVDAILRSPLHVIVCTRAKQAYDVNEVEKDGRKKQEVVKLGLAPVQRADLEYEFQVVVMMDQDHAMSIGKTRCLDLAGRSFKADHQGEFAELYADWLTRGDVLVRQSDADLVRAALKLLPAERRKDAGTQFTEAFGHPDYLLEDRLPAAWALVSALVGHDPHPFVGVQEPPDPDGVSHPELCETCELVAEAGWHTPAGDPTPQATQPPPPVSAPAPQPEEEDGTNPPEDEGHTEELSGSDPVEHELPITVVQAQRNAYLDTIREWSTDDLKAALEEAGQPTNGSKDALRARLANHVLSSAS